MIVCEFPDMQAINTKQQNGRKKIIDLLYLLEERIRMESVPHVLKRHTFICTRRALAESTTLSRFTENFPWIFAIYHQYLAFLKFKDGIVYRFKISGCRTCSFCNSLNRCLSFTFLLYNFNYSKAFIKNYERVSSEMTEISMCLVFYCL